MLSLKEIIQKYWKTSLLLWLWPVYTAALNVCAAHEIKILKIFWVVNFVGFIPVSLVAMSPVYRDKQVSYGKGIFCWALFPFCIWVVADIFSRKLFPVSK